MTCREDYATGSSRALSGRQNAADAEGTRIARYRQRDAELTFTLLFVDVVDVHLHPLHEDYYVGVRETGVGQHRSEICFAW